MLRFRVRGLSLIHGVLAASAWAGVTVATRALHAPLSASYRHAAPLLRSVRVLLVVFGFASGSLAFAQTASFSPTITTLGGGFDFSVGVAVDGSGNVYVADDGNSAVKEMPAGCVSSSCVTTLGGGINNPVGVAVDGSGNVYVADSVGGVREMPAGCASSSCVTTLGGGFKQVLGVAVDGSGNVYVADYLNNAVKEMPPGCASSSCVTTLGGGFSDPWGVAVDGSGNVYVGDNVNRAVVYEMPPGCASSSCVTALGGGFLDPLGVAVDGSGNVYVLDSDASAVKEMPAGCASSSCVTTLASGFSYPEGVAVDGSGNVYVADTYNNAVKEIEVGVVKEIEVGVVNFLTLPVGSASAAQTLTFTFVSGGNLNSTTPYSVLTQGAKNLDFKPAVTQGSNACNGTTAYAAGETCTVNVTFTPQRTGARDGAVELLNAGGSVIATAYVYGTGQGPQVVFSPAAQSTLGGGFSSPTGVAADGSGNVYVADHNNSAVKEMPVGCASSSCVTTLGGGFSLPFGVAVDGSGNVYVADTYNSAVKEMPAGCASSSCVTTLGGGFSYPWSAAVDGSGNVYVADYDNNAVKEMPAGCASSSCVTTLGGGFNHPSGVGLDGSGNVYVADSGNSAVKEMPAGCASSSCVTTLGGGFGYPTGVVVDGGGIVYVGDQSSSAVKEMPAGCVSPSCVTTLGGGFDYPTSVALDGNGNIYVADEGNNAAKEINRATPPSLSFATTAVGSTSSDSPQTVTVQNIGNAVLTFEVPSTGDNPSISANFTLNSSAESACPLVTASSTAGTLVSGASCLLSISFEPTTPGSFNDELALTDNNLNAASPNYAVQGIRLIGATPGSLPIITSVSPILPQQTQTITISGASFGTQAAYTGDSNYIALVDTTAAGWNAGHSGSAVTLAVSSWTDSQIVLSGFSGSYGTNGWCISPGDQLSVRVWNAKTGAGPAIYPITASSGTNTCTLAISSVSAILPQQTQTITINGTDFGTRAAYTGDSNYIELVDTTAGSWSAGHGVNAVTLAVSSWTNTQIVLSGFSGAYGTNGWCISPGDQLSVQIWNAQSGQGPAVYPVVASGGPNTCTLAINSVSPILPQQTQTITINGSDFGTQAAYTGDSNYIELTDLSGTSWNAGHSGAAVTLAVSSWTNTQIVLTGLSGAYGTHGWCIKPGDQLSIQVWNAQNGHGPAVYPITASSGTNTCP